MGRPRIHTNPLKKYGRLTAIKELSGTSYSRRFLCECNCGKIVTVHLSSLLSGNTKSCGCLKKELLLQSNKTHGLSKTRIYSVWNSMKDRCLNKKCKSYKNYGGRNILIYPKWIKNFQTFYDWAIENGYEQGLTLERVNNNGDYCPENCTWIPLCKQSKNRRGLQLITFQNKTQSLSQWVREKGLTRACLRDRLKNGWTIEKALTTPKLK